MHTHLLTRARAPTCPTSLSLRCAPSASECATASSGGAIVNDVWFTHTALADNGVLVSTCGHADFDTQILVYDGCGGELIACNENSSICPDGTSLVGFMGVQGETYLIRVAGVTGSGSGEIDIAWGEVDEPYADLAVEWSTDVGGNGHHYALYALGEESSWAAVLAAAAASTLPGLPPPMLECRRIPAKTPV